MSRRQTRLKGENDKQKHGKESKAKMVNVISQEKTMRSQKKEERSRKVREYRESKKSMNSKSAWLSALLMVLVIASNYAMMEIIYKGSIYFEQSFSSDPEVQNGGAGDLRFAVGVALFLALSGVSAITYDGLLKVSRNPYPNDLFRGVWWLMSSVFRVLTVSAVPTFSGYALTLSILPEIDERRILATLFCVILTITCAWIGAWSNREGCRPGPQG